MHMGDIPACRRPLAAFGLTTLAALAYMGVVLIWEMPASLPNLAGHLLVIWLPVILSALLYASLADATSASAPMRWLRVVVAGLFAPTIAAMVVVLVGFVFLGRTL
jgi:hypothetical protein